MRFNAKAAEIVAPKKKFGEEQATSAQMVEDFRKCDAYHNEEARRRDEEAKNRYEIPPILPVASLSCAFAVPSTQSVDAGTSDGGLCPTVNTAP